MVSVMVVNGNGGGGGDYYDDYSNDSLDAVWRREISSRRTKIFPFLHSLWDSFLPCSICERKFFASALSSKELPCTICDCRAVLQSISRSAGPKVLQWLLLKLCLLRCTVWTINLTTWYLPLIRIGCWTEPWTRTTPKCQRPLLLLQTLRPSSLHSSLKVNRSKITKRFLGRIWIFSLLAFFAFNSG